MFEKNINYLNLINGKVLILNWFFVYSSHYLFSSTNQQKAIKILIINTIMDKIAKASKTYSTLLKKADITECDVMVIWDTMSLYIREELSKKRGEFFYYSSNLFKN